MAARTQLAWLIIALVSGAALAQSPQIKWAPDLATAKQASAQFKVPLLVHFYGDGCVPCQTLQKNVLSNPEVIQILNKFFICVSINGSRDRKTMSEFEVHSYPTDVFVSPTGEKLYQGICPQDLREYLATLERVAVMNRDYIAQAAAKQPDAALAQQPILPNLNVAGSGIPGLPAPNKMPSSGPSSGTAGSPGFYAASGAVQAQQQLQNGAVSSDVVQSGPLTGNQQPPSIRGAVQSSSTQLSSATSTNNSGASNALPTINGARDTVTGVVPHLTKDVSNAMMDYAQMPSMDSSLPLPKLPNSAQLVDSTAARVNSATNDVADRAASTVAQGQNAANNIWNGAKAGISRTMQNPHFENPLEVPSLVEQPKHASPAQPSSSSNQVVAQAPTASQQPALGSNVEKQLSSMQPEVAPQKSGQVPVQTVSSSKAQPALELQAALDGYCPVSLRGKQWRKGDSQYAVKHRGMVFCLADQASQDAFMKQPDYYMPILLGCDPMILLNQGQMQTGSTQFGLFEDRVGPMFFCSAESKAEFLKDFSKNMTAIEAILRHASMTR